MTTMHDRLRAAPRPVLVDVWAPWCRPCRAMAPVLERVQQEYAGRVDVLKLNADDDPDAVRALGVLGIPTLIVFRGGREVARRTGAPPAETIRALFEAALSPEPTARIGLAPAERLLRLGAAAALFGLGVLNGPAWVLVAVSALLAFSAVYDRCPLWQAVWPRVAQALRLPRARQGA